MALRFARRLFIFLLLAVVPLFAQAQRLTLQPGDRIVLIGGTFAERMQHFGHLEALLTLQHPTHDLTFRNLGWSGDTVTLRPRPLNFGDLHTHLRAQEADVIFVMFGANESFNGPAGLPAYERALSGLLDTLRTTPYNSVTPPRVVVLSPIAQERGGPNGIAARNENLARYTEAMAGIARRKGLPFADVFTPTQALMQDADRPDLTSNGLHLNAYGDWVVALLIARELGLVGPSSTNFDVEAEDGSVGISAELLKRIAEKNETFFHRWRAVNGEYIYGRRQEPFGVINFPGEMQALDQMVADQEAEIHALVRALAEQPLTLERN